MSSNARFAACFASAVVVAFCPSVCAWGASSQPTVVHLNPEVSYLWRTAPSASFTLHWSASSDVTGTLEVKGLRFSRTVAVSGRSCQLELPAATDESSENLYNLKLTLNDGSVRTASIAVVAGMGAGGDVLKANYRDASAPKKWAKFKDRAVLPIPAGTETFSIDGETVDTGLRGAAGWYMLQGVGVNEDCVLALDGKNVTVHNSPIGLILTVW